MDGVSAPLPDQLAPEDVSPKRAGDLTKSLIVDLDAVIAGTSRPLEERHTAAASALILATRLIGGVAINIARIASAMEKRNDEHTPIGDEAERYTDVQPVGLD